MNRRTFLGTAAAAALVPIEPAASVSLAARFPYTVVTAGYMIFASEKQMFRWADDGDINSWTPIDEVTA